MHRRIFVLVLVLITIQTAYSQEKKTATAIKTEQQPAVDGKLDDKVWNKAPKSKDFFQYSPYDGGSDARFPTSVKYVYTDDAIYVGARMHDPYPDSILTELSERDDIKNTSYCGVYLDPYNDAKNAFGFFVTASGVQVDKKSIKDSGEDWTWDAVWESAVNIDSKGWVAELRIPYSALRIPNKEVQTWGLQFYRLIRRHREMTVWNHMNPEVSGRNNQFGQLEGIKNIEPPLRLSVMPYVSGYADYYSKENAWEYSYKGGMDMKIGINESFTLDMILIPDFGQVQSDDKIVNLSPFETRYSEKRPFFKEGTELFNKSGIFYSRRIGDEPIGYDEAKDKAEENEEEVVVENPDKPQLINASKISGKTSNGLGLGFLNAMTAHTEATLQDTITGEKRHVETAPFTNYNMIVVDQALNENSFVSFANTNVYRGTDYYTANVSALDFRLTDKNNQYSIAGKGSLSQKYRLDDKNDFGHKYRLELGKVSGNFKWRLRQRVESDTYDPNDMGFLRNNNEVNNSVKLEYDIFESFGRYLNLYNDLNFYYGQLYQPRAFTEFSIWMRSRTTLKNHKTIGFHSWIKPVPGYDYFEPRNEGWKVKTFEYANVGFFLSPDYRKSFLIDVNVEAGRGEKYNRRDYEFEINPRIRFNDKFTLRHSFEMSRTKNEIGYVTDNGKEGEDLQITFGKRNRKNITNTLNTSYIFTNKIALDLRVRHYWLQVDYNDFYNLQKDGTLEASGYDENKDFTTNIFNLDMTYSWRFAPGSEMTFVWKNAIYKESDESISDYFKNFERTLKSPYTNSFSLKILYYLDYEQVFNNQNTG
ncbi:MAG: carbohydrate binding family 9 domain-containing protein [Bacteroidales bacterium]|nr:carbohydrate binding family 9 domain-containing protein [Bacteroidales bacterium]MCF8337663.1 carbohydrate binding family 9 domain-containing protein [Bacteroidales bacterium]